MTLTFEQTEQDYIDFNFYYLWERPERRWTRILSRILPVPLFMALISTPISDYGSVEILFILFIFFISMFFTPYMRWRNNIRIRRVIRSGKNTDMVGIRTVQFTNEGVIETTNHSTGEIKWTAFEYLRETQKHLFLFVTVNQAIILPKRIFSPLDEVEVIKKLIYEKIATHKQDNDGGTING